jgi:hypothetical protein
MSTFKDIFLKLIEEDNVAGGAISAFGPGVATNGGIYDPGAGRINSNDASLNPGYSVTAKALGGVQRRRGISKKSRKKRKKK